MTLSAFQTEDFEGRGAKICSRHGADMKDPLGPEILSSGFLPTPLRGGPRKGESRGRTRTLFLLRKVGARPGLVLEVFPRLLFPGSSRLLPEPSAHAILVVPKKCPPGAYWDSRVAG